MQVTTIGLDLAKRVFQVHAVDASGQIVTRRKPAQHLYTIWSESRLNQYVRRPSIAW